MPLHNIYDKRVLQQRLEEEPFKRITISFYRYFKLIEPKTYRDALYKMWSELGCFGRVYIANEGINAQMSIPEHNYAGFLNTLEQTPHLQAMPIKTAVEDDGKSFYKLSIKVREKLVADGLDDHSFDVSNVGNHLDAKAFNDALAQEGTLVVDMRNHYESEIGHFEGAIKPDADTFREELPQVLELLSGKEQSKILLYCTGGIRCEKASAYLKHHGFKDVNQLHGGIIDYARQIKENGLQNKFKGKNFVFDNRLGERIGQEIISSCHQCGQACDTHTNCSNEACHLLFIQCSQCAAKFVGACCDACAEIAQKPANERKLYRKTFGTKPFPEQHHHKAKNRLRPKLTPPLNQN